jgi:putative transposase
MCFRLIDAEKAQHPVSLLCSVLGVSRAGYYAWKRRPPSPRAVRDRELTRRIVTIHCDSFGTYGRPRVHAALRYQGVRTGGKRVARLMRSAGLSGLVGRRRGKTTIRVPGVRPAPDLVRREFRPAAPNRLWVADLTEVASWEGKLYLAVVVDAFSRRCVGWAMAEHMRAELVVEALEMAIWRRQPARGLVHHSDQGGQYVSLAFGQRCRQAGINLSMGARGCALDNAVCEAFFASLKKELIRRRSWPTRRAAQTAIFTWIEGWYNRRRPHSTLGYLSPAAYERQHRESTQEGLIGPRQDIVGGTAPITPTTTRTNHRQQAAA